MRNLLELKEELRIRKENFDMFRINIAPETVINESIQLNFKQKIQGKIQEKVGEIQEKVGEIKRFSGTMKKGYFNRPRSVGRSYKAMI